MESAQASRVYNSASQPDIKSVTKLCAHDMSQTNELIRKSLDSNVILIRQIAEYIIGSGGKRLRPQASDNQPKGCWKMAWVSP